MELIRPCQKASIIKIHQLMTIRTRRKTIRRINQLKIIKPV